MAPAVAALIFAGSLGWAAWVAALIDRGVVELLPAIWFMLGFGWLVGWWLGHATAAVWTVLGLGALSAFLALSGLAAGTPGAGLPLLIGTVPAILAAPLAHAGGRFAERRRDRSRAL